MLSEYLFVVTLGTILFIPALFTFVLLARTSIRTQSVIPLVLLLFYCFPPVYAAYMPAFWFSVISALFGDNEDLNELVNILS